MAQERSSRLVDIAGQIRHRTKAGVLFYDGAVEVWLPRSQVEWHEEDGVMVMPEWLATEKGLI
jgi:prepilin-type processing-associated H-X9-DG protein